MNISHMNDTSSLSNMTYQDSHRLTSFTEKLKQYDLLLTQYSKSIGNLTDELSDQDGTRVLGGKWQLIKQSLRSTSIDFTDMPFSQLISTCDSLEDDNDKLDDAAGLILSPIVKSTMLSGMSKTYSDSLSYITNYIVLYRKETRSIYNEIMVDAASFGSSIAADVDYTMFKGHNNIVIEILIGVVMCSRQLVDLIAVARDNVLGVSESEQLIKEDMRRLSHYHPLQRMVFNLPQLAVSQGSGGIDISAPQAQLRVTYNLNPLIDRKQPPLSMATGLNYGVVQRLKTIEAVPVQVRPRAPSPQLPDFTRHLRLTVGGSTSYDLHFGKDSAPFAGCHPRVEALGALCEEIVLGEIRDEAEHGWGPELRKRFEAAVDLPDGVCNKDLLAAELVSSFTAAYDAAPPENSDEFREMVMPLKFMPNNYMCIAMSRLAYKGLYDGILLRLQYKHAIVKLPYNVSSRELKISQMVHSNDAAKTLWKRIKRNYKFYNHEAFAAPPEKKKIVLVGALSKIVDAAISDNELVCDPSTLKKFALSTH